MTHYYYKYRPMAVPAVAVKRLVQTLVIFNGHKGFVGSFKIKLKLESNRGKENT